MWARFADMLHCPSCKRQLVLDAFERATVPLEPGHRELARQRGVLDARFDQHIEAGLLLCNGCNTMYPILGGLPILLRYDTQLHHEFLQRYGGRRLEPYSGYRFPSSEPPSGERAVMSSFSREWLDYDYDGVIWEMSYDDHERRFLKEVGPALDRAGTRQFLEVGCGLGITTYLAYKNSGADAVGLDLSLAVLKASRNYRTNPFLHFVQASVFAMPFAPGCFDLIYSRGVLHHTVSTEKAFDSVAPLCRPGGSFYLWVYGPGSIGETALRKTLYGLERLFRPALSAAPESPAAKAFLAMMGLGYVAFNGVRRMSNPQIQPLTLTRGVHAARDRFTPRYAHRHEAGEVLTWFRRAGFKDPEVVDWRAMPPADHDDYRRNVGIRGRLASRYPA